MTHPSLPGQARSVSSPGPHMPLLPSLCLSPMSKVATPGASPDPRTRGPQLPCATEGTGIISSPLHRQDSGPRQLSLDSSGLSPWVWLTGACAGQGAALSSVTPAVNCEAWACVRVRLRSGAPEQTAGRAPSLHQDP